MSSPKDTLLHCYHLLETGGEGVNEVTPIILEIYSNPENISILFELNLQSESKYVQKISVIGIKNIIKELFNANKEIPADLLNYLKSIAIQGLQSEVSEESKKWYIFISTMLLSKLIPSLGFPELIEVASNFIQDPLQIQTGLLLWSNINKELSADQMSEFVPGLMQAITVSLRVDDRPNVRILGLGLFLSLLERQCDIEIFKTNQEFHAALQAEYERAIIGGASEDERSQTTETIAYMIRSEEGFEVLEPSFKQIYHITFQTFFDDQFSWKIRLDCLCVLNAVIDHNPKLAESFLEDLIPTAINLTVEQCNQEGRENFQPHFTDVLFTILASDEDIAPDLIAEILANAQETLESNSPDIVLVQVLVQIFAYLSDGARSLLAEFAPDILNDVFFKCLEIEDESIISATCVTMSDISETSPSFFNGFIDQITTYLINLHENEESLKTLQAILQNSDESPSDVPQVVYALIQLIQTMFEQGQDLSYYISVISQLISKYNGDQGNLYNDIRDIIIAIIKNGDCFGPCFELFSYLCKMNPNLASNDIQDFLQTMVDCVTPDSIDLAQSVSIALRNIAITMPETLENFIPQLSESLIPFIASDITGNTLLTDDEKAQENESKSSQVQGCILVCLAAFITASPIKIPSNIVEEIINMICNWVTNEDEQKQSFACDAINDIAPGLSVLQIDPEQIISSLYASIDNSTDIDICSSLLSSLAVVIANCGQYINDERVSQLFNFILDVISSKNKNFLDEKDVIDKEIASPFFYFFKCFVIGGLAQRCNAEIMSLVQPLLDIVENQYDINKILSILAIARLSFVFVDNFNDIIPDVIRRLKYIMENARTLTADMKGNCYAIVAIFSSLNVNFFGEEELSFFVNMMNNDVNSTQTMISSNACLAMVCIAANGIEIDQNVLKVCLSKMPPPCDEEDVIFFAKAATNLQNIDNSLLQKSSVSVFGSSPFIINLISPEILSNLLEIAKTLSNEYVVQLLGGDEASISRFRKNVQQQ